MLQSLNFPYFWAAASYEIECYRLTRLIWLFALFGAMFYINSITDTSQQDPRLRLHTHDYIKITKLLCSNYCLLVHVN